ncbi:MAG: T9SS type A sorting domain-containing protein [bacterium]|nr:T9SS type A sorting domain-containing protein [bacterium]
MKKNLLFLALIALVGASLFAYEGPNVPTPFKQLSWVGGDGQLLAGDNTMFFESERILTDAIPLTLDYIEDTNFAVMASYPPAAAPGGVLVVNGLITNGDTTFAYGGHRANVSYTYNLGTNWTTYDTLPVNQTVCEVLDAEYIDGVMYAGGYFGGMAMGFVYKSSDKKTWVTAMEQPVGVSKVFDILHVGGDTFLLATGDDNVTSMDFDGAVFRSFDNCSTWTEADTIGYALINDLLRISNDTIFACGDNLISGQPVMISTDGGDTWAPTGTVDPLYDSLLATDGTPFAMLNMSLINGFIYAGSWTGELYRTDDMGTTWEKLDTTNAISDTSEVLGIYSFDDNSVIYVATSYPGILYKSTDGGYTMEYADEIPGNRIEGMTKIGPHTFAIGATTDATGGKIYVDSYFKSGYLVSSAFNIDQYDAIKVSDWFQHYKVFAGVANPRFSSLIIKVRTASDSLMSDAVAWTTCPNYVSLTNFTGITGGKTLDSISSVVAGQSYFQYRFDLGSSKYELTTQVDSIWMQKVSGVEILNSKPSATELEITKLSAVKYLVSTATKTGSVKVFDMAGRMVMKSPVSNGKATLVLDIPAGKYSIRVYDDKNFIGDKQITVIK